MNPRRTGRRKGEKALQSSLGRRGEVEGGREGVLEGGKRPLTFKSWSTIKDVKQTLQTLLHVPMNKQRLFFNGRELSSPSGPTCAARPAPLPCSPPPSAYVSPSSDPCALPDLRRRNTTGMSWNKQLDAKAKGLRELSNYGHSLQDCGIVRDGETIYFTIAPPSSLDRDRAVPILRPYGLLPPPRRLGRALKQVNDMYGEGWLGPYCVNALVSHVGGDRRREGF